MSMHPIKTLEDGTRIYSNGTRYKPKSAEERKYKKNKPEDPNAIRHNGDWFVLVDLIDDDQRVMPLTRPDSAAYGCVLENRECECEVCSRPEAKKWRQRAYRDMRDAKLQG